MRIWIDTEFNAFGGSLISLALVAEDGSEFYETLALPEGETYDPWVDENVVPHLNKNPISRESFQKALRNYILKWESVHIVADWPDDIRYFCESLITGPGQAINTPLKLTMQIDRELNSARSAIPHNALEDARAIARSQQRLQAEARGYGVQPQHTLRIVTLDGSLSRRARLLIKSAPQNVKVEVVDIRTCTEPETFVILDEAETSTSTLTAPRKQETS